MNTIQYSPEAVRCMQQVLCFPGPAWVMDANGISIASVVFAGLTKWQTDWQTDRPRFSVGNNRRSAQWRSQILLLSTATTSIYWSSRLDRSDQLQQSAAIFSCKTRRVVMYVETHYNIASKRPYPTGDTTVYLFTDAQAVYFLHSTIPSGCHVLRLSDASVICRVTYFQFPI